MVQLERSIRLRCVVIVATCLVCRLNLVVPTLLHGHGHGALVSLASLCGILLRAVGLSSIRLVDRAILQVRGRPDGSAARQLLQRLDGVGKPGTMGHAR